MMQELNKEKKISMNNRHFSYVSLIIVFMFATMTSNAQDVDSVLVTEARTTTQMPKNDCTAAAIHYERKDIPDSDIVKMFEQAEKNGDVRGTMWLARLYYKGRCSLPKRSNEAQEMAKKVIDQITKLAESGDSESQFLLGSSYHEGLAVDLDFTKAVKWYSKAAATGHTTAANNLGVMLVWGRGADPNIDKARSLFARAAEQGSKVAVWNLNKYPDDGRDDTKRLANLQSVLLVQALGMQKDKGISFLAKHGLISDPKGYEESVFRGDRQYHFKTDGIVLNVENNDRIINIEGHAKGSRNSEQFRGDIPFGLSWNDTPTSVRKKLGRPNDSGSVSSDDAYGMAYRIDNVFFAVIFSYTNKQELKLWRVHEKWAVNYPAQQPLERNKSNELSQTVETNKQLKVLLGLTEQKKSIPCGSDAYIDKDYAESRTQWLRKILVESYVKHGKHDPRWDSMLKAFLPRMALRMGGDTNEELLKELNDSVIAINAKHCNDPLFAYCSASLIYSQLGEKAAKEPIEDALNSLTESDYPRYMCFLAARRLHYIVLYNRDKTKAKQLMRLASKFCVEAATDPIFFNGNQRYLSSEFNMLSKRDKCVIKCLDYESLLALVNSLDNADPWLVNLIAGCCHIKLGWEDRGGGYSYTVDEDGWKGFGEHLQKASEALIEAHRLHPEFPEAADEMIAIAMGGCTGADNTRDWFNRAVEAQLDYLPAYDSLRWSLRPRWGGSHEEMLAFGRECLATARFDTLVPLEFMNTLYDIDSELKEDRGSVYKWPGVKDNMEVLFNGYISQYLFDTTTKNWYLGCYAAALWNAGDNEKALRIYEELGEMIHANVASRFWTTQEEFHSNMMLLGKQMQPDVVDAMALLSKGDYEKSLPMLLTLIEDGQISHQDSAHLCEKLVEIPLQPQIASRQIDLMAQMGRYERLVLAWRDYVQDYGDSQDLTGLREQVIGHIGIASEKLSKCAPKKRLSYGPDREYAELQLTEVLLSINEKPEAKDRVAEILAKCRIDTRSNPYRKTPEIRAFSKSIIEKLKQCKRPDLIHDFITENLSLNDTAQPYYMMYYYLANAQPTAPRKLEDLKNTNKKLDAITDPKDLPQACAKEYQEFGGCRLALSFSSRLWSAGYELDAVKYDMVVTRWCRAVIRNNSHVKLGWPQLYVANIYNLVYGYENKVIKYAKDAMELDLSSYPCCVISDAYLRLGNQPKALHYLEEAYSRKKVKGNDFLTPIPTPVAIFKDPAAYRVAILESLLVAPELPPDLRSRAEKLTVVEAK